LVEKLATVLSDRFLTVVKSIAIVGYEMDERSEKIVFVKVPLPREFVELAEARGVSVEELVKAAETLLLLEVIAMESKLEMKDALEIADEVTRRVWARLKGDTQQ